MPERRSEAIEEVDLEPDQFNAEISPVEVIDGQEALAAAALEQQLGGKTVETDVRHYKITVDASEKVVGFVDLAKDEKPQMLDDSGQRVDIKDFSGLQSIAHDLITNGHSYELDEKKPQEQGFYNAVISQERNSDGTISYTYVTRSLKLASLESGIDVDVLESGDSGLMEAAPAAFESEFIRPETAQAAENEKNWWSSLWETVQKVEVTAPIKIIETPQAESSPQPPQLEVRWGTQPLSEMLPPEVHVSAPQGEKMQPTSEIWQQLQTAEIGTHVVVIGEQTVTGEPKDGLIFTKSEAGLTASFVEFSPPALESAVEVPVAWEAFETSPLLRTPEIDMMHPTESARETLVLPVLDLTDAVAKSLRLPQEKEQVVSAPVEELYVTENTSPAASPIKVEGPKISESAPETMFHESTVMSPETIPVVADVPQLTPIVVDVGIRMSRTSEQSHVEVTTPEVKEIKNTHAEAMSLPVRADLLKQTESRIAVTSMLEVGTPAIKKVPERVIEINTASEPVVSAENNQFLNGRQEIIAAPDALEAAERKMTMQAEGRSTEQIQITSERSVIDVPRKELSTSHAPVRVRRSISQSRFVDTSRRPRRVAVSPTPRRVPPRPPQRFRRATEVLATQSAKSHSVVVDDASDRLTQVEGTRVLPVPGLTNTNVAA